MTSATRVLLLTACVVNILAAEAASENNEKPPHIVIILADDMGTTLRIDDHIGILGVDLTHDLNFARHIEDKAKLASKKLGILNKGWNDVGFHGSAQVPTPNMDALAYSGVQLHAHYAPPLCTPARAALLTGKYPIHTGMQHLVLLAPEPRGLDLRERLLPQLLQERGYSTHIVGKWHLGYHRAAYTPVRRGFHSHYGYWNGFQDYYEHTVEATLNRSMYGVDMRRNLSVSLEGRGRYATHLYTEEAARVIARHPTQRPLFLYLAHLAPHTGTRRRPMQPPPQPNKLTEAIGDTNRRDYAAMTAELDVGVGAVLEALRAKDMLKDTVVLLLSDNGAPTRPQLHGNYGSNHPLRGEKNTPWEGGGRTVGVLWSAKLAASPRIHTPILHITDWFPTLYRAAGGDPTTLKGIDGVDAWAALHEGKPSRHELLINIDLPPNATVPNYWSMRRDRWKLLWTQKKAAGDAWLGDSGAGFAYRWNDTLQSQAAKALESAGLKIDLAAAKKLREAATVRCPPPSDNPPACVSSPCLFDLEADPCETLDVSALRTTLVDSLHQRMREWIAGSVPPGNLPADPRADPALHDGAWSCWMDEVAPILAKRLKEPDHWEYVWAVGGCVVLFMVVCGSYAGWKRGKSGEGCCGDRAASRERTRGSLVARRVQIFEDLSRESGSRKASAISLEGLKTT